MKLPEPEHRIKWPVKNHNIVLKMNEKILRKFVYVNLTSIFHTAIWKN